MKTALSVVLIAGLAGLTFPQDAFILSSSVMSDGDTLPADLKCTRNGGDGLSPPIAWANVPGGTQSLAVVMDHYPRGRVEGVDTPSQYWLLWNIPPETRQIARGNPTSIGDEGADKDERGVGYTPPCAPDGSQHEYTITVFAMDSVPDALPSQDDPDVDWRAVMDAFDGRVIETANFTFLN